MSDLKNKLCFGDNLPILRENIESNSVDLIYLDPPFNSNATYNVLYAENSGEKSAAQITAFDDTWHWGLEWETAYQETVIAGGKLAELLQAFRSFLGQNDMMAYLVMIAVTCGFYQPDPVLPDKVLRMQILTIKKLLEGKKVQYPRGGTTETFKKAEKKSRKSQPGLFS